MQSELHIPLSRAGEAKLCQHTQYIMQAGGIRSSLAKHESASGHGVTTKAVMLSDRTNTCVLTYMYVCADVINEAQHLCMAISQHRCWWQAGQLSPQRHQLLLGCCHQAGPCCGRHLDQLLAHGLTQPQGACSRVNHHKLHEGATCCNTHGGKQCGTESCRTLPLQCATECSATGL